MVTIGFPTKKSLDQTDSWLDSTSTLEKNTNLPHTSSCYKSGSYPPRFIIYKASTTLTLKSNKKSKKGKLESIILDVQRYKLLSKIFTNRIQRHIEKTIHHE